ncbi:hypothetical protein [Mycolicibacterium aichiense]|nr:hypothetical protein [Mycolicibacterium aichiense]MCV7016786.1 hypothetical protein [Mycolicibacterium aichiense]
MQQMVFLTLTPPDGEGKLYIEHREITSVYELPDGSTEVAGYLVKESFEQIFEKLTEAYKLVEGVE